MPLPEIRTEAIAATSRPRQLRLLQVSNPITTRLGPEVFASLPHSPGVYFFYDAIGKLLYIGQSLNLRARVTSYRHVSPERHPRRILRLVHRIARIEWQTCDTAEAAIELERVLLLQHRPPFNRAGTWQPEPWYLHLAATQDYLHLTLARAKAVERSTALSFLHASVFPELELPPALTLQQTRLPLPLPRTIHAALCRCLVRLYHPDLPLSEYPAGLLNFTAPIHLRLPFPGRALEMAHLVTEFMSGRPGQLVGALQPLGIPPDASEHPQAVQSDAIVTDASTSDAYWAGQMELIRTFAEKKLLLQTPE